MKLPNFKPIKTLLEEAKNRFNAFQDIERNIYFSTMGLKKLVEERRANILAKLQIQNAMSSNSQTRESWILNQCSAAAVVSRTQEMTEFVAFQALLAIAEESKEFKAAASKIEPALAEIEEQEAAEQKQRAEFHRLAGELRSAQEAEQKRALNEFNNLPETLARRRQLEAVVAAVAE